MTRPSLKQLIEGGSRSFSFEFFPPKDAAGEAQLWRAITELEPYRPTFVSVTYGAGGSSRDATVRVTGRIAAETSLVPVGHLTCVGHTPSELEAVLDEYAAAGVGHVLALRGDPEAGPRARWRPAPGGLAHASELVALAASRGGFEIGVAAFSLGHPASPSLEADSRVLLAKQRAGARFAITDMVFAADDYAALVRRAREVGVEIPIVPGIMPILNLRQVTRMAELSGHPVPAPVRSRLGRFADDPAGLRKEGVALASELCEELLAGDAPGLHFYTLNRSTATREIFERLRISV